MTLGLPVPISFQSSNVPDEAPSLDDVLSGCSRPTFTEGFEIKADTQIWEYNHPEPTTPDQYDPSNSYEIGDVVWYNCWIYVITSKKTTRQRPRPFQPEEYGAWDTSLDPTKWRQRYFRVSCNTNDGWLNKQWHVGNRWYYMFWEARGNGGCGDGGWRWSAKDKKSTGPRHHTHYLRSCLKHNYATKFEEGKDVPAVVPAWKGRNSNTSQATVQFRSVIERNGYFYFRTSLDIKPKYHIGATTTNYTLERITSPADIPNFVQKRMHNAHNPFDGKNYTNTVVNTDALGGYARWTFLATNEFDSLAFGRIVADHINIFFKDTDGNPLFTPDEGGSEINNYVIANEIDFSNPTQEFAATNVVYAKRRLPAETVVEIEVFGSEVKVGEIMLGNSLDAGFTNLTFKNKFRDFSPKEQDQWGNIYYRDGVRVSVHSGTVQFPVVRYDQLNRMMLLLGGNKVIIDGSDAKGNESADGQNIFEATMMIGRFTQFELSTNMKDKRLGDLATYTFTLEEIV